VVTLATVPVTALVMLVPLDVTLATAPVTVLPTELTVELTAEAAWPVVPVAAGVTAETA
jgi:hypothetical protein